MARDAVPCPHCGAIVPARALACPSCGSDAGTGWSEQADDWAGDLPTGYDDGDDDEFDYEETLRREGLLDDRPSRDRVARARTIWIVVLLILMLIAYLARG